MKIPGGWWPACAAIALAGLLGLAVGFLGARGLDRRSPILRRLTLNTGLISEPSLTRDGRLLAYISESDNGHTDLWYRSLSGGVPQRLTDSGDALGPSFSPDGSAILYWSESSSGGDIFRVMLDGRSKLLLRGARSPCYSPTGNSFLYSARQTGSELEEIFVSNTDKIAPRSLSAGFRDAYRPVWSADGSAVLFCGAAQSEPADYDWWVVPASGGRPARAGAGGNCRFARERSHSQLIHPLDGRIHEF